MLVADALKHFGQRRALARAAGVAPSSLYSWGELVPEGRAARLERATNGALKYDPDVYQKQDDARKVANY